MGNCDAGIVNAQPACEPLVPFEELMGTLRLEAVAAKPKGPVVVARAGESHPTGMEPYYEKRAIQLSQLVGIVGQAAETCGRAGSAGFRNPCNTLARRVKEGGLDDMPVYYYDQLLDVAEDFSELWEGQPSAQGYPLVANALLRALFEDEDLFCYLCGEVKRRLVGYRDAIQNGYSKAKSL